MGWRLLSIHNRTKDLHRDQCDWSQVERVVGDSNPVCKPWIKELATFVRNSPTNGELLYELSDATKTFAVSHDEEHAVVVGKEFFTNLNKLWTAFGAAEKYPLVINAVLKAHISGGKVSDGIYRTLQHSQLSTLTKKAKRKDLVMAEQFMEDIRVVCRGLNLAKAFIFKMITRADVRVGLYLMGKGISADVAYKSVDDIAMVRVFWFVSELCLQTQFQHDVSNLIAITIR